MTITRRSASVAGCIWRHLTQQVLVPEGISDEELLVARREARRCVLRYDGTFFGGFVLICFLGSMLLALNTCTSEYASLFVLIAAGPGGSLLWNVRVTHYTEDLLASMALENKNRAARR